MADATRDEHNRRADLGGACDCRAAVEFTVCDDVAKRRGAAGDRNRRRRGVDDHRGAVQIGFAVRARDLYIHLVFTIRREVRPFEDHVPCPVRPGGRGFRVVTDHDDNRVALVRGAADQNRAVFFGQAIATDHVFAVIDGRSPRATAFALVADQPAAATVTAAVTTATDHRRAGRNRSTARQPGQHAATRQQTRRQHRHAAFVFGGDVIRRNHIRAIKEDKSVVRAPFAPGRDIGVLRKQRPAIPLGKGHFAQNTVRAQEQATVPVPPEIILENDHPAIGQQHMKIVFRAVITAQIGPVYVQRDFAAIRSVDQISEIFCTNHTTLDRARICTDHEINRVHNHTTLPQNRPFSGSANFCSIF